MSDSKHTKGPWHSDDGNNVVDGGGFLVATRIFYESIETTHANARLISAAPELLEALKEALTCGEPGRLSSTEWRELAKAAIAKAKGEL